MPRRARISSSVGAVAAVMVGVVGVGGVLCTIWREEFKIEIDSSIWREEIQNRNGLTEERT